MKSNIKKIVGIVLLIGIFTGYQAYYNMPENWTIWLNNSFSLF